MVPFVVIKTYQLQTGDGIALGIKTYKVRTSDGITSALDLITIPSRPRSVNMLGQYILT